MLFSTKAEYGVRLMVALGRQRRLALRSRSPVAEAETLPLSYLEHLVAKLRKAGLVDLQRGARGGYRLARPAAEIKMLEVVEALEGQIAPMECFRGRQTAGCSARTRATATTPARRSCSGRRCTAGSTKALAGTTLAELIEFSGGGDDGSASSAAPPRSMRTRH